MFTLIGDHFPLVVFIGMSLFFAVLLFVTLEQAMLAERRTLSRTSAAAERVYVDGLKLRPRAANGARPNRSARSPLTAMADPEAQPVPCPQPEQEQRMHVN